jgi:hypothetical protein
MSAPDHTPKENDAPSPSLNNAFTHSVTTRKKHVVAVFHNGTSLPNLDGAGHSYLSLIGTP